MFSSRRRGALTGLIVLTLVAVGCGDDDGAASGSGSASEPGSGSESSVQDDEVEGSSTVTIGMVDFGYEVSGALATGTQTFETTNSGDEIHMMGIGKLKKGVTIDDVVSALSEAGEGGGGEAPEPEAEASADASGAEETESGAEAGDEGDDGGDPFEDLFESDIGAPGHILFPGTTQKITLEDDLDVGSYALICFIPAEGDGVPHFAKGMVNALEVVESGGETDLPEADAEYALPDSAVAEGPDVLDAGEVTLKLTNTGDVGKDFVVAQLDEGEDIDSFDRFFEEAFEGEGPPPAGVAADAPGTIAGSTFEIPPGQTIYLTVDLTPGEWVLLNTTNVEGEDGEEADDAVLVVTVT